MADPEYTCPLCRASYNRVSVFPSPKELAEHVEHVHRWEVGRFLMRHSEAA